MSGIPCTSPARTLVDLAGVSSDWTLRSAFERAAQRRKLDIAAIEAKVLPLLIRRNLPAPLLNAPVEIQNGRIEVDFLWPDHRLVVEADSRDFHSTPVAFERDRWRDRELMRAGYATLRVTHRQAESEAAAVADTIAAQLLTRPRRASS